jgi:starch phosphorylase
VKAKDRLASYIERTTGVAIRRDALFDIQVKRIHEYKRQFMNALGCIHRYIELKKLTPEERSKVQVPRVSVFAGKYLYILPLRLFTVEYREF